MNTLIEIHRGHFKVSGGNKIKDMIRSHFRMRMKRFEQRHGKLTIKHDFINGYLEEVTHFLFPIGTLADVCLLLEVDEQDLESVKSPLLWSHFLDPKEREGGILKSLPDLGGKIPLHSDNEKTQLIREMVQSWPNPRGAITYVCSTYHRCQKIRKSLGDLIASNSSDDNSIGAFELMTASPLGIRHTELAVFVDDPLLLATNIGRRYWESCIRHDIPLLTFTPGKNIGMRDREIIDLRIGKLSTDQTRFPADAMEAA